MGMINRWSRRLILGSLGVLLALSAASAQVSAPREVAQAVYARIPNLPVENQYIRVDGNKQAVDSTLVSRLIQYHNAVKGRSPLFRLDWKITLADYLGINEPQVAETYPGNGFLKQNPLEGDRTVIQRLSRAERNALVQALVDTFTGGQTAAAPVQPASPTPAPAKPEPLRPALPPLAVPGSADLLQTRPIGQPVVPGSGEAQFLK